MSERILYPVIHLLGGRMAPALREGDGQLALVEEDPLAIARRWRDAGARWLHLVDLDGAREGAPRHLDTIREIIADVGLPAQVAGGLRDPDSVEAALDAGATRVVLNGATPDDQALVAECVAHWGERVAVALEARDGRVTVAGWLPSDAATALDVTRALRYLGVSTIILTSISTITPDPTLAEARTAAPGVRLIAGGASGSLDELGARLEAGMDGALLGRALYEERYTFAQAQVMVDALPAYQAPTPERDTATGGSEPECVDSVGAQEPDSDECADQTSAPESAARPADIASSEPDAPAVVSSYSEATPSDERSESGYAPDERSAPAPATPDHTVDSTTASDRDVVASEGLSANETARPGASVSE